METCNETNFTKAWTQCELGSLKKYEETSVQNSQISVKSNLKMHAYAYSMIR